MRDLAAIAALNRHVTWARRRRRVKGWLRTRVLGRLPRLDTKGV
jgi:hypothetical protein